MTQTMLPGMPALDRAKTVGSQEMANLFVDWYFGDHHSVLQNFSFVGEGATRSCFLAGDGVVYKIETDPLEMQSETEWDNYLSIHDCLPVGWSVPVMTMYYVPFNGTELPIIAAEYITGTPLPLIENDSHRWERFNEQCDLFNKLFDMLDVWDYNVCVRDDGTLCVVDLGL